MTERGALRGAQAGFAAGGLVGLAEGVIVLVMNPGLNEIYVLPAALLGYGLLGLVAGLVVGPLVQAASARVPALAARAPALPFTLTFAAVLSGLALVVGRFRLVRDLWDERPPSRLLDIGLLVGQLALAAALVGGGERLIRRSGGVARWTRWAVGVVGGLVVLTAVGAVTVSRAPASLPPSRFGAGPDDGRPDLILIMVDTLRADRLGAYGYTTTQTPAIDALARDGVLFEAAIAQASWTKPSVASLFTSLYPSGHQTYRKLDVLPDRVVTLAEALAAGGYYTAAFVNNPNVSAAFNFQQGFIEYRYLEPAYFFHATESTSRLALYGGLRLIRERFVARGKYHEHYYRDAQEVTDQALRWLDARPPRPFFLFLHYMDPHDPYFVHPYNGEAVARVHTPNPDPAEAGRLSALYDGEVAYLDEHLGRLWAYLRQVGLYDGVVIVLTADHGEEFQEHGGWWHGTTLYDEQIRIPLIVKLPDGRQRGRRVAGQVRTIDIGPTLLAAAGVPVPLTMLGHSLLAEGPVDVMTVFAEENFEGTEIRAVRGRDWKLIEANPGNPRGLRPTELYQLEGDPGERRDLAPTEAGRVGRLRGTLERLAGEARRGGRDTSGPASP